MESSKKEGKRLSLDAFKAKANSTAPEESLEKIGGGIYDCCHTSLGINTISTVSLSANIGLNLAIRF